MSTKTLQLEGLKSYIDQQNPHGAKEYIDNVVSFFDHPLTQAELELAFEKLFGADCSTVSFLKGSIGAKKLFHQSNVNILTLWHNLLTKHCATSNFSPYVADIIEVCMKFIVSSLAATAKERERSTMVLQILFQNKVVEEDHIDNVLERVLNVFNVKKPPEHFAHQIFKLLGTISRFYPECVSDQNAVRIKIECFKSLDCIQVSQQEIRFVTITGAMEGLADYLHNFAPCPESEPQTCEQIYAFTKKLSNLPDDVRQKSAFRAALQLFTNHATLFSKQIYRDFRHWHDCLGKWLASSINDDRRLGVYGSYAFHQIIAKELKSNEATAKETLQFLLTDFRKTLESSESKPEYNRIAIKGFGIMSPLCKRHLPSMLDDMISLVIQRCELIVTVNTKDLLDHFPDYIQALSTVIRELKDPLITEVMAESLRKTIIRTIMDFPYTPASHTLNVANSLCSALYSIYLTDITLLERFTHKIVSEGVILTCSHKNVFEAAEDWDNNIDWKNNITFKSYSKLWHALLDESITSSSFDKCLIVEKLIDELMRTLFFLLEKVNLKTKKRVYIAEDGKDQEFYFCDPNFDLSPVKPKDFQIFINVIDFYRDLWPKFRHPHMLNWIKQFCEVMVRLALQNPLISGFLKLIEVGLNTAEYLKVFDRNLAPELEETLAHALKIMIVNCQRVSGELQISTIELVLQYPAMFYEKCLIQTIPIFEIAFDLGKSMAWLANLAIDCLEKISTRFDSDDLKQLHIKILPLLDSYLQGNCSVEYLSIREGNSKNKIKRPGTTRKIHLNLHDIQAKIVSLLGKLHPEAATMMVMNCMKNENLVKWDSQKCVHLNLKYPDISPVMYLDALIPRICHLALTSPDRHTKIAACEVVHALVLYLIGARAHQGQTWKELCKRMLILGCDADVTVVQIFEPLLMQVMHFMSKYENLDRGVEEVMDALMDGISSKSNFGLRDLSASCLREFVEWSIKQTTPQQLAASQVSIDIILARLKMYSFDSNSSKRVGAALAFNNLYRRLREEETICDVFFVDLLHTFCVNFKLSEELSTLPPSGEMNSDLEMISEALDHVVRVLSERNYLYKKESSERHVPDALNKGTLHDVLKFLILETGSSKTFYRRKCMKLAQTLAPKITEISSLAVYFEKRFINDDRLRELCEGTPDGCGIRARPDITFLALKRYDSPEMGFYKWLESLLASLECYKWLLHEKAIRNNRQFFDRTKILLVIVFYLENICWKTIPEILGQVVPSLSHRIVEIKLGKDINVLRSLILLHIIDFLTEFLHSGCALEVGSDFWSTNTNRLLREMILQLIYEPRKLNLDSPSQLPARINKFCLETRNYCPHKPFYTELNRDICDAMVIRMEQLLHETKEILTSTGISVVNGEHFTGMLMIFDIINFDERPAKIRNALISTSKLIMKVMFESIKRMSFGKLMAAKLPAPVRHLAQKIMIIQFKVRDCSSEFVEFMLNTTELYTQRTDSIIKHGWLFSEIFGKAIYEEANTLFFEECFTRMPNLCEEERSYVLRILTATLEYKIKLKYQTERLRNITTLCINKLTTLIQHYTSGTEDFQLIEYLRILSLITKQSSININQSVPSVGNWILTKLRSEQANLEEKCKIITLLPIMVSTSDYENIELMTTLEDLQRKHFPLRSTEFSPNSLEETSLKFAFISLLKALVESKSFVILEFLFKCTASDLHHLVEDEIRNELNIYTTSLSKDEQVEILSRTFDTTTNEQYEPTIRMTIFTRFLMNIFDNCNDDALVDFVAIKIKQINLMTEANYRIGTSGRSVEQALTNRIMGYKLLEHFFGIVKKELYWSITCPIAVELLTQPKADSELVGTFTKKAFYVRTEEFSTENREASALFRIYQCAAYCALCALVSNTQTQLKFYSKFLFEENTRKNEIIWARLIDCSLSSDYLFPKQELDTPKRVKKNFVAIRRLGVGSSASLKQTISTRRLQTENIMGSSLSQDVRGIDMTSYSVRLDSDLLQRRDKSAERLAVELKNHALNSQQVMQMLCGVIEFMYVNGITPVITDNSIKRSYPWVQAIANAIGGCEYHKNIRVFLAQLVYNCSNVFCQFAHVLFKPILRMLVDECAGNNLNFFITDQILMLIDWSDQKLHLPVAADEVALIQDLLKFVMKNAWSSSEYIVKFNIELVQAMFCIWKSIITVPSNLLLDMITRSQRSDSTANECGLTFLGVVLSNDLIPWTDVNKILYINAILRNIENDSNDILRLAAYALGVTLAILSKSGDTTSVENLTIEIRTRLQHLIAKKDHKSEKRFWDIAHNIHKSSPEIIDHVREAICFKIPTAVGVGKKLYLEMILSRIESFEEDEIFNTIIGIGIRDLLKHSNYQLLSLHILNRALPMLKTYDITSLFQLVEESLDLQNTKCRDVAYEICIYVAQNYTTEHRDKAVKLLLKGISDPDIEIQKRIYQFWSKELEISPNIIERLIYLLRTYATNGERHFLVLCTQLILDPAIESSESKKQIFAFEDDRDAKLYEYKIKTNFRTRSTYTMPPLFAESQQTRPSLFKATQLCSLVPNTNANYVFEPTQDPTIITQARENFNMLSQSSMPFEIGSQVLNRRSQTVASKTQSYSQPRRFGERFPKDTERDRRGTVQRSDGRLSEKIKETDVKLYRRYRFGEYPDLLINNLAFLLPLQALARKDLLIAKQIFVAMVSAILEAEESDSTGFLSQIDDIFQLVLCNSTACESTTFSAFLEVSLLKPSAFNLPPKEVTKVAKATKNLTIGALYLENRLNADWDDKLADSSEPQHWQQLADIYNSLKEFEVVSAIFADKIRTDPRLAEAIELRANGRADEAQSLLVDVIGRNVYAEQYYAYNCYYECSVELSNWSHVSEAICNEIDSLEELWTDNYNLNFLLPKLVHAKIQLLLEGDVESRDFLNTIKEWMMVTDKADHMKNAFCEEIMMLWIANRDFRQCRVLHESFLKKFLREWSVTSSLCTKTKLESLLNAQRVAEIDYYAQQFLTGFDKESASGLCKRWNSCAIDRTDSLRLWNTVVGYRKYIAALGVKTLQDRQIEEQQEELTKSTYNMTLQLFNAAEHQKNFPLAQRVYDRLLPNESNQSEMLSYRLSKVKNIFLQSHRTVNSIDHVKAAWEAITTLLNSDIVRQSPEIHVEAFGLKAKIALGIVEKLDRQHFEKVAEVTLRRMTNNKSDDIKAEFLNLAFEALKSKISVASSYSGSLDVQRLADGHLSLAQFAYDNLNRNEATNYAKLELEKVFISSVFSGMRFGSKESRQLFPCALQLSSMESGVLHSYFEEQSLDVPVWAYLAWIPQILSHLELTVPCYLDSIIQKIASIYPEALRYPFNIWYKQAIFQLNLTTPNENYIDRKEIKSVMDNLQHKLYDKFVKSFKYLAVPEAYLIAQLESFDRDIRNQYDIQDAQFKNLAKELLKEIYYEENGLQGVAYRRLLKYKPQLEELINLSFAFDEEHIRKTLSEIVRSLRRLLQSSETTIRLETICPLLANYQWCGEENYIELPGQYAQNSFETDPKVLEHTKIVRFNAKIRVLISQRYPLRITIHGSNGYSYDFLVKHGEDLKQDQRIQQILQLMSQKLQEDKNCQSHNLYIRTYQVVPIDRNCGVLSWVKNTVSLHDFVLNCFSRHCPNSHEIIEKTVRSYLEFIGRPSNLLAKGNNLTIYGMAASKYTRDELLINLRSLENEIEPEIVKIALMDMAISPESFFALRNNFATSLAAMNIAHWILGVGDRHLQNTLISATDGSVTGIDFGFTFGSGTRDQKVPELTPFRLTPHLVNAMAPMNTSGLIFKCMVHALRVFRNAERILLACMEVFVREPSVNWLDMVKDRINEGDENILRAWEPRDRIDIARCKLQGSNPMYLFERELNVGLISRNIEFLEGYMKILRGQSQFNIRSRLPKENLSVEDQVKCLIDQAIDPAVLGISYVGFSPWI